MAFTHCALLARIPAAFSDQVVFSRVASRHCLEQFICSDDLCRTVHNLAINHEWSRTTDLTARSAYVKTLVSRPVILTRKKAVLALAIAAALTTFGLLEAQ